MVVNVWASTEVVKKPGYVKSYKLELHTKPVPFTEEGVFFSVVVTDDEAGANPETYILEQPINSDVVDLSPSGDLWAISYGNVNQGIIATLKDALLHGKKVTVHAIQGLRNPFSPPDPAVNPTVNRLTTVEIHA